MNYIEQIFNRFNIETLCDFLIHGGELIKTNNEGYYERVRKADEKLSEWLNEIFTDTKESDKHFSFIHSILGEFQSIYMQISLQAGIMLAAEFDNKKSKTQ